MTEDEDERDTAALREILSCALSQSWVNAAIPKFLMKSSSSAAGAICSMVR